MMHATIISQLFCLWQSILLGLFISISYEVIRIIRRIIKHKMIFIHLELLLKMLIEPNILWLEKAMQCLLVFNNSEVRNQRNIIASSKEHR